MSITLRISLTFLILSALGFYYFAKEEMGGTTRRYREATEEPLVDLAYVLAEFLGADGTGTELRTELLQKAFAGLVGENPNAQIYNLLKTTVDIRVYVTDDTGKVVFDSRGRDVGKDFSHWNDVRLTLLGSYGARTSRDDDRPNMSVLYVAAPIRREGRILGVVSVAKPNDNANLFIDASRRSTLVLGFVSFFTVAGLAVILSLIVTRPIHALTQYARAVRDGKRTALPHLASGELKDLGEAFEEMREALEGRKYVEQYVQTLTHEIKSPLTAIRGAVELLKEDPPEGARLQFMQNIERETGRAQDLVNKLLSLSALQRRNKLESRERVEIRTVLESVIDSLQMLATARKQQVRLDMPAVVSLSGDPFWLGEAFTNVLQNALEFSPQEGTVKVSVDTDASSAIIRFEDDGSGVPDWAIGKIFDQFYSLARPDTGKRSSGLGLTIVREVAELHGGSVELENRPEGGARVTIRLPLSNL